MARMTCPTALVCFLLFYCPCLAFDGTEWWNHGADWSSSWSFRGGAGRASSSRRRRPQKSQRERQAARPRQQSSRSSPTTSIRGTKRSSNGSADTLQSALQAHASRDSVQTTPRRRACGLYIWDAPSALLYRWCNHLMKDCVYEGKGGKKFVRIRPGSMLQLLYPAHRYSPDKCLICGGTFDDHLTLWWAKKKLLYTPYDRILDETFQRGVVADEPSTAPPRRKNGASQTTNRNRLASSVSSSGGGDRSLMDRAQRRVRETDDREGTALKYIFHRQYVQDTSTLPINRRNNKQNDDMRIRNVVCFDLGHEVDTYSYWFPYFRFPKNRRPSVLAAIARITLAETMDRLIELQASETRKQLRKQ